MGKKSKIKNSTSAKSKKLRERYQNSFNNHTLTRSELERFGYQDKVEYLSSIIRQQHPNPRLVNGELASIGGWYNCMYCALASVFGDGYVSED